MRKILFLILPLLFLGCGKEKEFKILSINKVNSIELNTTGIDLEVEVVILNGFNSRVVVKNATLRLSDGEKIYAQLTLTDRIKIFAKSQDTYTIPIRIRTSLGSLLNLTATLREIEQIELTGEISARKGMFGKRVKFSEIIDRKGFLNLLQELDLKSTK